MAMRWLTFYEQQEKEQRKATSGFFLKCMCEICGKHKSQGDHRRCSKIKQQNGSFYEKKKPPTVKRRL